MMLPTYRVSTRIYILIGLALLGLMVLCFTALYQLREGMLADRKAKLRNLVEVAVGIVSHHHKLALEGKMPDGEARLVAREALRNIRYEGKEYIFIHSFHPQMIYLLLPPKPELEGSDSSGLKDVNGKYIIRDLTKAAREGGGYVEYWYPRPGQQQAEPKLSYAAQFAPWNWVIGTGIYIDDIDSEYRKNALLLGGVSAGLLILLALCGWQTSSSILLRLGGEPQVATEIMQRVADGDLTARIENVPANSLLGALGTMVGALRDMVGGINGDANRVVENAEKIACASGEIAKAAELQADSTSAMAAAIEELTVSSSHISDSARESARETSEAAELAGCGSERVNQATAAIEKISKTVSGASGRIHALEDRTKQVSTIAGVIKDIAGQTNLLALNAAIEAARAGEQGRGFAVVADEVRKLAERTACATLEIEQVIVGIQQDTVGAVEAMNTALPEVHEGVHLASLASESLLAIEGSARRTLQRVGEVADATREQSAASTAIAQRVEQIANMVEETTETIRGTAASAHELQSIATNLRQLVGRFKTDSNS
ncbi:methyl-accepting chemotaxis protein [Zoogloea sp.]|uniref:methyl-accepting chemotaxis protein n=1 Tax=Zoogloea sp. TaxID=49181 RepID=UPI001AC26E28|nr:methyl-accepting chemotaxis protein [Zoogloea sp.]MBN8285086.1 methyl-accepting chemotaxis protein [Zoogloea sp.]